MAAKGKVALRKHLRAVLEVAVEMESKTAIYNGTSDNISEGGIFVFTDTAPPPMGTELELRFCLPNRPLACRLKAIVCWLQSAGAIGKGSAPSCGLRWINLPEESAIFIRAFVMRRDPASLGGKSSVV